MTTASIGVDELALLRDYVERQAGLALGEDKRYLFESRLSGLLKTHNLRSYRDLHRAAMDDRSGRVRAELIDAITTHETLWFRDTSPFTMLSERILPALADQARAGRRQRVRIWCAACSTGQEPYSLAISALEFARTQTALPASAIEIVATDISEGSIAEARAGSYGPVAMGRGLAPALRDRYFAPDGRNWVVKPEVKALVRFQVFNLKDSPAALGRFDIVLCRYVAIYFSDSFKRELYARIARVLEPGGYLFLGASESLSGHSDAFRLAEHGRAIAYQPK